jgi:uncharacterized protein
VCAPVGCDNRAMSTEPIVLTAAEARVLGSLLEKEIATPEYYPLSLNALVNACNQRSNREPVMNLDEDDARQALRGLEEKRLAGRTRGSDSRVTKYEHWLGEAFNFSRAEAALLCVLLLRGPQTPGELRARTERMHRFEEISDVAAGLQKLTDREPPLAAILPRQPGAREARYAHLLSPRLESIAASPSNETGTAAGDDREERIVQLEREVSELRKEMAELKKKLDDLFA